MVYGNIVAADRQYKYSLTSTQTPPLQTNLNQSDSTPLALQQQPTMA